MILVLTRKDSVRHGICEFRRQVEMTSSCIHAKILVTGGAGFIGSHIVDALVRRGDQVRVLDNLSTGNLANLAEVRDKIEFIEADLNDADKRRPGGRRGRFASFTKRRWPRCRGASRSRSTRTPPA